MAAKLGLLQVYTGDGKGKTTASLGLALRAVGRGLRVKIFQFMKPPDSSGEHFSAKRLAPELEIVPVGKRGFVFKDGPSAEDIALAEAGLEKARQALASSEVDLVILDELDVALHLDLLKIEDVLEVIDNRPAGVELVVTGRGAPQEIIDRADLVTEMRLIKHPYQEGIKARQGIEY